MGNLHRHRRLSYSWTPSRPLKVLAVLLSKPGPSCSARLCIGGADTNLYIQSSGQAELACQAGQWINTRNICQRLTLFHRLTQYCASRTVCSVAQHTLLQSTERHAAFNNEVKHTGTFRNQGLSSSKGHRGHKQEQVQGCSGDLRTHPCGCQDHTHPSDTRSPTPQSASFLF